MRPLTSWSWAEIPSSLPWNLPFSDLNPMVCQPSLSSLCLSLLLRPPSSRATRPPSSGACPVRTHGYTPINASQQHNLIESLAFVVFYLFDCDCHLWRLGLAAYGVILAVSFLLGGRFLLAHTVSQPACTTPPSMHHSSRILLNR